MTEVANSNSPFNYRCTVIAALLSVFGVAGSLWLSIGMHLKACPLCLYQRAFVMSAAAVLLVGLFTEIRRSASLPLLALPAVVSGLGVAAFHEYLELTGKLECPAGLFDVGSAPQQSLAVFLAVLVVLVVPTTRFFVSGIKPWQFAFVIAIGTLIAIGTIKSAPPMPPAPTKPYDQPLEICRPPHRPA